MESLPHEVKSIQIQKEREDCNWPAATGQDKPSLCKQTQKVRARLARSKGSLWMAKQRITAGDE